MSRLINYPQYIRNIILSCLLLCSITSFAEPAKYVAGKDYVLLDTPVRTRDSSKVEVVEVFWFGCSHCYHFEPLVKQWKKNQASDVDFWRSPAMWSAPMKLHAKMFFTAKALGVMDTLNNPFFTTLVVERKRLDNEKEIEGLFTDYGVKAEDFRKTFNSFSINSQVKQADARARSYKITGTPEVIVNGKYRVTAGLAGGQDKMLTVVDFLINKERKQLSVK